MYKGNSLHLDSGRVLSEALLIDMFLLALVLSPLALAFLPALDMNNTHADML